MEYSTELRRIKLSWWREAWRRSDWLFWGVLGVVALCFVPVVGWLLAPGVLLFVLWKTFGPREVTFAGTCPGCTKSLTIDPKIHDVVACPVCGSAIRVESDRLTLVHVNR